MKRLAVAVLALVAVLAIFIAGGITRKEAIFPWPQLATLRQELIGAEPLPDSRYRFAADGRLVADEMKTVSACPRQTERTAVLLVVGQSNAANHGGQRFRSLFGARIANFFEGSCVVAASPLLGSTETAGEYWTQLGNLLLASTRFDQVVIAPVAVDGSEVARWATGGDLNQRLSETLADLDRAGYRVTNVLWHQGEADYVRRTSANDYRDRFLSMVETLRKQKVDAPVYVSVASKCLEPSNGGLKTYEPDNEIVRAQMALAQSGHGIRLGVNTDALLDGDDRHDDCHFGGTGAEKVAKAWAAILLADLTKDGGI